MLPGIKDSVLAKTVRVTEARLARSGSRVTAERRTPHDEAAVAEALTSLARDNDMVVIFGASAMSDFDDVIPAAIRQAGGEVMRAGMPVDPGNLMVLGSFAASRCIGAPGCARSPKENGFDWVLDRLIAGLDVTDARHRRHGRRRAADGDPDTAAAARDCVRAVRSPRVDAVVLAAGRSSRMGGPNKLMALFDGKPLVRRTAETALASRAGGGRGRHRPSGRARARGARRARRQASRTIRDIVGPGQLAEGRHRAVSPTMRPAR